MKSSRRSRPLPPLDLADLGSVIGGFLNRENTGEDSSETIQLEKEIEKLKKDVKKWKSKSSKLTRENKKLKKEIKEYEEYYDRFDILDLEEK